MDGGLEKLTAQQRTEIVQGQFCRFDEVALQDQAEHPQSLEFKETILVLAQVGIWGKLNQISPDMLDKPFVGTGQQPTLNWGVYRRFGKRAGTHREFVTVHLHADHDHAKKEGFGEVSVPILTETGIEYKNYQLLNNFNPEDIMHDVPTPPREDVLNFFNNVIGDVQQGAQAAGRTVDTSFLESCREFITDEENYGLIRSAAELNGAIQTYLVRCMSPETKTLDIMLSDLMASEVGVQALARQMIALPQWIKKYNEATRKVNDTDYGHSHFLPQPLEEHHSEEENFYELPLWVLHQNGGGRKERRRAWLRTNHVGVYKIGMLDHEEFVSLLEFAETASPEDVMAHENFSRFSPAAVTLVDMLRVHLHMPFIHGKTGHYYESINELVQAALNGQIDLSDDFTAAVVDPTKIDTMTNITSVDYTPRKRAAELRALKSQDAIYAAEEQTIAEETQIVDAECKTIFQRVKEAFKSDLDKLGLSMEMPIEDLIIAGNKTLAEESKILFSREPLDHTSPMAIRTAAIRKAFRFSRAQDILNVPARLSAAYRTSQEKVRRNSERLARADHIELRLQALENLPNFKTLKDIFNLLEKTFSVYRAIKDLKGEDYDAHEAMLGIFDAEGLEGLKHLWTNVSNWLELRDYNVELNQRKQKAQDKTRSDELKRLRQEIRDRMSEDTPLLVAAMYRPNSVAAIAKAQRIPLNKNND